ncbi:MAG: SpoIIE family protein phosphatase [Desulfovermiculus sp.]
MLEEPLGEILTRKGFCSPQELQSALKRQAVTGEKLGTILVQAGALDQDQLIQGLLEQFELNKILEQELQKREKQIRSLAMLEKEIDLARSVQQNFLPTKMPSVPGLDIYGTCRMSDSVGGDLLDIIQEDSGGHCMLVADICGHGFASSLVMASFRSMAKMACTDSSASMSAVAGKLNSLLCSDFQRSGLFITGLFLRHEPGTHNIELVNAGHIPPLSNNPKHTCRLAVSNIPLGIYNHLTFQSVKLRLEPGDHLLLYSVVLLEAPMISGQKLSHVFLRSLLGSQLVQSSEEVVARIMHEFDASAVNQSDDITVLSIWRH